jgi:hypothetical protein
MVKHIIMWRLRDSARRLRGPTRHGRGTDAGEQEQRPTSRTSDQAPAEAERLIVQRDDEWAEAGKLPQRGNRAGKRQEHDHDARCAPGEAVGQRTQQCKYDSHDHERRLPHVLGIQDERGARGDGLAHGVDDGIGKKRTHEQDDGTWGHDQPREADGRSPGAEGQQEQGRDERQVEKRTRERHGPPLHLREKLGELRQLKPGHGERRGPVRHPGAKVARDDEHQAQAEEPTAYATGITEHTTRSTVHGSHPPKRANTSSSCRAARSHVNRAA